MVQTEKILYQIDLFVDIVFFFLDIHLRFSLLLRVLRCLVLLFPHHLIDLTLRHVFGIFLLLIVVVLINLVGETSQHSNDHF